MEYFPCAIPLANVLLFFHTHPKNRLFGTNYNGSFHGIDPVNIKQFLIETVSPEGTFCDTVQVPSNGGDMELI